MLNKHVTYMNFLNQGTVKNAIESLYMPIDNTKKAILATNTKATAIDYCLGLTRNTH